jgi:CRP-like cAMP-binding protein
MIQIELTRENVEMLREILASHLSELRMEIACTDRRDFREYLRKRGAFLEQFLQDLERELASTGKGLIHFDRLRKVEIFQGLTDWELKIVAQFFQEERAKAGVSLCREGEIADRLFILEEGVVTLMTQKGESYELQTPGKIIGWSFLVSPNLYTATVNTLTPCSLLVMKSPDFYYLIHKEPKMGVKVMDNLARVVASRLRGAEEARGETGTPNHKIA